ncbi:MAG: MBL fold metallo-hydrolase [Planctomycetota bacterium]|jgi:pyrroloquinoline quinone biosynthesis protein B
MPGERWELVVLGIAQDGGIPHIGCEREPCASIRRGERKRERVVCLGITDGERAWLLDATPDLPSQVHSLGIRVPAGVFLTHAHIGHYTGLMYLGKEALGARNVPLYASDAMHTFLRNNGPWSRLVEEERVIPTDNASVDLGGVRVTAFKVPHRDELSDTVGYHIRGPKRSVLYIPDIDSWDQWDRDLREAVGEVDFAFLDATFYSDDELPTRIQSKVPHPRVTDTMDRLEGLEERVRLIHLNHTNPLLLDPSPAEKRGYRVAKDGERLDL